MRSTWTVPALMVGLGILLAPAVGDAAVVYRTSGAACQPEYAGWRHPAWYQPEAGLYHGGPVPVIGCAIPTSEATFTPATLTQVNIRYRIFNGEANLMGRLVFHDYDSHDYVECGENGDVAATGYGTLEVLKSCSSSSYEDTWGVVPALETSEIHTLEFLTVKLITVFS